MMTVAVIGEKGSLDILINTSFCVPQKKEWVWKNMKVSK